jgi:aspartate aminotransferase-like enzyme
VSLSPLLDVPPFRAERFAQLESRVAELLSTRNSVILLQGEATVALEAVARGVGRPDITVLNVVSGPYGKLFGTWLETTGASVIEIRTPYDASVAPDAVEQAMQAHPEIGAVGLVHAEAATGNKNPLADIARLVRARDAILMVDAVASAGAEVLQIDGWGVDLCVIGAQKALAGPAGVSVVTVSDRGWAWMEANRGAPRQSALSLLDWKHGWIDSYRQTLPVIPSSLELSSLEAATVRVMTEGVGATIARHRSARAACRAGLRALRLTPWVERDADAANIATTVRIPGPRAPEEVLRDVRGLRSGSLISAGVGPLASSLLRVNHTGRNANPKAVSDALRDLATIAAGRRAQSPQDADRLRDAQAVSLAAWDEERAVTVPTDALQRVERSELTPGRQTI